MEKQYPFLCISNKILWNEKHSHNLGNEMDSHFQPPSSEELSGKITQCTERAACWAQCAFMDGLALSLADSNHSFIEWYFKP